MLNELKEQLAVTIKAYQNEGKPIPDELWTQGCLLSEIEDALKDGDEDKFVFMVAELLGGGSFSA